MSVIVLLTGCTHISPLVVASHHSDPTVGSAHEHTSDFIGAGITATFGDVSIDAAVGRKALDCDAFTDCASSAGGLATIRWSPGRGRRSPQ